MTLSKPSAIGLLEYDFDFPDILSRVAWYILSNLHRERVIRSRTRNRTSWIWFAYQLVSISCHVKWNVLNTVATTIDRVNRIGNPFRRPIRPSETEKSSSVGVNVGDTNDFSNAALKLRLSNAFRIIVVCLLKLETVKHVIEMLLMTIGLMRVFFVYNYPSNVIAFLGWSWIERLVDT